MAEDQIKIVTSNKKARHDYHITETLEAGLVLSGTEVKSLRAGRCNLRDSYAKIINNEAWLIGMHISQYENAGYASHDPEARRKLLLNRNEIKKLHRKVQEKGVTLIPLKVYFKNGWAKVELGLASGKRKYDKREDLARRDREKELKRLEKKYKVKR